MTMFRILRNLKNYEFVCKPRGHHEPDPEQLSDFIKNSRYPTETSCVDCGSYLKLELDEDDDQKYWIREI